MAGQSQWLQREIRRLRGRRLRHLVEGLARNQSVFAVARSALGVAHVLSTRGGMYALRSVWRAPNMRVGRGHRIRATMRCGHHRIRAPQH
jgi:hypothetical protein